MLKSSNRSVLKLVRILKTNEDWLRQIVESVPNPLLLIDQHGVIVLVNSEAVRLFGYAREVLLSLRFEKLVSERFREEPANKDLPGTVNKLLEGERQEFSVLRADGSEICRSRFKLY